MKQECLPLGGVLSQVNSNTSNITTLQTGLGYLMSLSSSTFGRCSTYTGDLNSIVKNSIYNFDVGSVTNEPSGESGWAFLITLAHYNTGLYSVQFYIKMTSYNRIYMRRNEGGTWTSWEKVIGS